ncbi:TetR/AcrR family transcriptional regulator [Pendulispora albinea]|uniref:TetR/AcrR family transcriptional regulator n=1 Tax=Pendulispora albinea TaxID=2741071 RepID=A0ABZ2LR64_9BACT
MSRSRSTKKRPDAYHHGDLRRALIDAALRTLTRHGVEELSLRALARDLGVSPRAPYRHFATKEELLAAVAVSGFRASASFTEERLVAAGPDPLARLRAVGEAYVLFAVQHPAAFRIMYAPYATVNENAPELLRARAEGHAAAMAILEDAQRAGLVREGDPMQLALAFWSTMHGLATLLIEGQLARHDRPIDAAFLATLVSGLLLDGLKRP